MNGSNAQLANAHLGAFHFVEGLDFTEGQAEENLQAWFPPFEDNLVTEVPGHEFLFPLGATLTVVASGSTETRSIPEGNVAAICQVGRWAWRDLALSLFPGARSMTEEERRAYREIERRLFRVIG